MSMHSPIVCNVSQTILLLQLRLAAAALERVQRVGGWEAYGDAWLRLLQTKEKD